MKSGTLVVDHIVASNGNGASMSVSGVFDSTITLTNVASNGSSGVIVLSGEYVTFTANCRNNGANGFRVDSNANASLVNCSTADNQSGGFGNIRPFVVYSKNMLFSETTQLALSTSYDARFYSQDHDQVAGNHKIFSQIGLVSSATDQRNTASGVSWKLQPTDTLCYSGKPLRLKLATVACAANSLVTIKAWMRRSNTGLTMRLVCKGGQIAGVDTDVVDSMTAAADTWAEQTITFTPTEVGVVEIIAEAFGGTTFSGWVDDLTISQA
jgi:hypothetical protein